MIYSVYKKKGIKIGHIWFCNNYKEIGNIDCNLIYLHRYKNIINEGVFNSKLQYTLITDLTKDEDEIYKAIRKNFRYEIRRVERENVRLESYTSEEMKANNELLGEFEKIYNLMYESKGMHDKFNMDLVKSYMDNEAIVFTVAYYNDEPLVFHSYIKSDEDVRFFYSASPFRTEKEVATMIGMMNKALHWYDIKMFKNMGIRTYDWGGIANPENPNGIDSFKMGFAGKCIEYNNYIIGNDVIGKIVVKLLRLKAKKVS